MEMKFDPMTGQPIQTPPQKEPGMQFDPMTGQPIQTPPQKESGMQFDPMTGQPIQTPPQKEPGMQFDPMTGQPIQTPPQKEPGMQFDPMTGQPIMMGQSVGNGAAPERRFDPMTGQPIPEKGKSSMKKGLSIAAGVVAAVALVGVVVVQAAPRIIYGKNYKIVQAIGNTFESNHLLDNLNVSDLMSSGKYTMAVDGSVENVGIEATLAMDYPGKEFSVEGRGSYMGFGIDAVAGMNDEQVLVSVPDLIDQTLLYSYVGEKDGYLVDMMEEEGMDIEEIDNAFSSVFSSTSQSEGTAVFTKASLKALKAMNFEKTDTRQVKIDGKKRKCQGYTLEIDEDLVGDLCDIYEDAFDAYLEEMGDVDNLMDEANMDPGEMFDEIRDGAEDIEGELTIYIYKKTVAAIVIESEGSEMVLELNGGNTPWENATLEVDGYEVMQLSGSVEKNVEALELEIMGEEMFAYEFDLKTGDLDMSIAHGEVELEGNVLKNKKSCTYKLSDLTIEGESIDIDGTITIQKGANVAKIDTEDVFDIGNASESDWEDLIQDVEDEFSGFFGY